MCARRVAIAVVLAAAAVLASPASAAAPSGLTAQGRAIWNLDALVRDRIGGSACVVNNTNSIEPSRVCRGMSLAQMSGYAFTFSKARHSSFAVVAADHGPDRLGNVVAVRLQSEWVMCGPGRWLVLGRGGVSGLMLRCVKEI